MRFIVFGDTKGKDNGINYKVLSSLLKKSKSLYDTVDFIVVLGDSIAGSLDINIMASQLNTFRNTIADFYPYTSIYPIIGNHEVNINPTINIYEKIFSKCYGDLICDGYLDNYNKTVYYKDFNYVRLIFLNSFHYGEIHKITNEQLQWLEKVLCDTNKNKIVFVHSPAFPTGAHYSHCLDLYPEIRDAFWTVLDNNNVKLVFSSHEHNYSRRLISNKNNILQIISGGGGEKLRDKYTSKNGVIVAPIPVYHFLIVNVENNIITVTAIDIKGKVLDEFSI